MIPGLFAALVLCASTPEQFNRQWNDGKAELDGYRLVQPRYGEARAGTVVMVWVTEPFSGSRHVKLDKPEAAGADLLPVLKLNLQRKFVTGIYDYSLMTSVFSPVVFARPDPAAHRAVKVSFTGQEWCGNVFQQLDVAGGVAKSQWRSYFESESDGEAQLSLTADTLLEDELWFRLRGLTADLAPGTYRLVPSLQAVRLSHTPMVPGTVEVKRGASAELKVPAGTFATDRWELALRWGPGSKQQQRRTVWIETAAPHRIIAWEADAPSWNGNEPVAERGELTGSVRDTYWEHHRVEDEPLRAKLGLKP